MNPFQPAPTPFDLRWSLLGVRFRVHPSFWIVTLLLGLMSARYILPDGGHFSFVKVGLWVLCMFVSVLAHELGHVIAGRIFGEPGNILLYSMGGLAVGYYHQLKRWQRMLVFAAGPLAGFLLLAVVALIEPTFWNRYILESLVNAYPAIPWDSLRVEHPLLAKFVPSYLSASWYAAYVRYIAAFLIVINLFLNLFNLLPVLPLDGGQIMREICTGLAPQRGMRLALGLSFLFGGAIAVYSGLKMMRPDLPYPPLDPLFNVVIFGMMALQNLFQMRAAEQAERGSEYSDG